MHPTPEEIDVAAKRFASTAAELATEGWKNGFRLAASEDPPTDFVEAFRGSYYNAMIDAYKTGAVEVLKMRDGDFTPEPWR